MKRTCHQCASDFDITPDDLAFYDKVSPVFAGKKELIPPPLLCPECRLTRRVSQRNLRTLYPRTCPKTNQKFLSSFAPDSPHTVFCAEAWWGDGWDALSFGRDIDFSRSFLSQWYELFLTVPMIGQYGTFLENCQYINGAANCKNCYLCFNLDYCEDSYYLTDTKYVKSSVDCLSTERCELCYECVQCDTCYGLAWSRRCRNCRDSFALSDCQQCSDCIGCSNLVGKQYHIFNEPFSKEEYEMKKAELLAAPHRQETMKRAQALQMTLPKKYYFGHSNLDSTGDGIVHTQQSRYCFDCSETEQCSYCTYVFKSHHCMDHTVYGDGSEWIYECIATGTNASQNCFCMYCWNGSHDNQYCHLVSASAHSFGCCSLKNQKYCILNKQYSKEEYEALVPKIIEKMRADGEWGEFFPVSMSPFAYNETVAQEYFPMTKEEVLARGWKWREQTDEMPKVEKILPAAQLPDSIDDIPDDILNWAIECEATKRPFKIIKQELEFYRTMRLPVPRFHPDERHRRRMALRNPRKLWDRECAKCHKPIVTSYSPERPEIVYCEECYLQEVY